MDLDGFWGVLGCFGSPVPTQLIFAPHVAVIVNEDVLVRALADTAGARFRHGGNQMINWTQPVA